MYDTFNFKLDCNHFDYNHIKRIFEDKMQFKCKTEYTNGFTIRVNYKNYSFSLSRKYLKANGSLTKLYHGNNLQNLKFSQVQDVLLQFESLFEIPFDKAIVTRVDLAACMFMDNPTHLYLDLLTTPSNYKPIIRNTSKQFENSQRTLVFYDKVAEARSKDVVCYKKYKNEHVLKFELRYESDLATNLGLRDTTFKNFYNPEVYKTLVNKWYQGYKDVPKLTIVQPSQFNYYSLHCFKQSLIEEGVKSLGGIEILQANMNKQKIKKSVKFLIKKYLDSFTNVAPLSPILQSDLDAKIHSIYVNELCHLSPSNT